MALPTADGAPGVRFADAIQAPERVAGHCDLQARPGLSGVPSYQRDSRRQGELGECVLDAPQRAELASPLDPTREALMSMRTCLRAASPGEGPVAAVGDDRLDQYEAPASSSDKFTRDRRWYLTGDAARVDEGGYFHFSSRTDDVIIMAGYRIGPFEIESILSQHPMVAECAVIAAPDRLRGEVIEAFVIPAWRTWTRATSSWSSRRW